MHYLANGKTFLITWLLYRSSSNWFCFNTKFPLANHYFIQRARKYTMKIVHYFRKNENFLNTLGQVEKTYMTYKGSSAR